MDNTELYILTIEGYEFTEIQGVFSDKEILLEKYLYLLENSCDATDYPKEKELGLCIYSPKMNETYLESFYELCEGGRERIVSKLPPVSPVEVWGEDVSKKIEASLQIVNAKKKKEEEWNALLGI